MRHPFRFRLAALAALSACTVLLWPGCVAKTASYHYTEKQIEYGDLSFHRTLRLDEYVNAFPQDDLKVEGGADLAFTVEPFVTNQPAGQTRTLAQVAVKTRRARPEENRLPLGLCFVLDVSGSMAAQGKMRDAIEALEASIAELRDGDELALVLFEDVAEARMRPTIIDSATRQNALALLKTIGPGGGTNIQEGLVEGYRQMAAFKTAGFRRILMLTDGNSTVETRSPREMAKVAQVGYQEGLRLSTIGLGHDVDEGLLRDLAAQGSGQYYFAENGKALKKILRDDLRSTVAPLLRDVKLRLRASPGFRVAEVHGGEGPGLPGGAPSGSKNDTAFSLGELNLADWRVLIVELEGDSGSAASRPLQATLGYSLVSGGTPRSLSATLDMDWHAEGRKGELKRGVARNALIFANGKALIEVGRLDERREYPEAISLVDLQMINMRALWDLDPQGIDKELQRFADVRRILAAKLGPQAPAAPALAGDEGKLGARDYVIKGLDMTSKVLPGIWGTVARLLIILIE